MRSRKNAYTGKVKTFEIAIAGSYIIAESGVRNVCGGVISVTSSSSVREMFEECLLVLVIALTTAFTVVRSTKSSAIGLILHPQKRPMIKFAMNGCCVLPVWGHRNLY